LLRFIFSGLQASLARKPSHAILAIAGVTALIFAAPAPSRSQSTPTLRVAYIAADDEAEAMYAKDAGFFTKAGLNVELQPMENAGAIATAIASNAIDVGFLPTIVLAIAHSKNIPLVAIAPGSVFRPTGPISALFVAPSAPIHKAADLNGKTIGVPGLASIAEYGARTWIDRNGGNASTVKFLEVPFPIMPEALNSGRIDAAMITEPFLTQAKKTERVLAATPFAAIAPEFAFGVWVTTSAWAKDHPDAIGRFAAALRETAAWANKSHAASGAILQKYAKIDPSLVASMSRSQYAERIVPATMQPVIDLAAKYRSFPSFSATQLIYSSK
jgi:NitT/TauT family transport system substrate-binding protein